MKCYLGETVGSKGCLKFPVMFVLLIKAATLQACSFANPYEAGKVALKSMFSTHLPFQKEMVSPLPREIEVKEYIK